jgi:hypothetical protein
MVWPLKYWCLTFSDLALRLERMRALAALVDARPAPVGDINVLRALPVQARQSIGPWVFLDHFGPFRVTDRDEGVPPHPHAGIETVTYLLSGSNQHRDSAGHEGIVRAGGAQWMTAGRGIVHAERQLATPGDDIVHGLQLWASLPRDRKLTPPRYQRIDAEDIPSVRQNGSEVRVIAGPLGDVSGPAQVFMPTLLWHVHVLARAKFSATVPDGFEVALYVAEGAGEVGSLVVQRGQLAVFSGTAGPIAFGAGAQGLNAIVLGGAPAEGPLVFHGPFVMNSREQVWAAERDYLAGRMGTLA